MGRRFFCPYCCRDLSPFEKWEGETLKFICPMCGHPIDPEQFEGHGDAAGPPKVLCIDDDQLVLRLLSDTLEKQGYEVFHATDGLSGMAAAKENRPDMILLDILMPRLDGFEVCLRCRADPDLRDIPVVLLTAMEDPQLPVKAANAGATLLLKKSFYLERDIDLLKTMRRLSPRAADKSLPVSPAPSIR